jgi:hypothetical protein
MEKAVDPYDADQDEIDRDNNDKARRQARWCRALVEPDAALRSARELLHNMFWNLPEKPIKADMN